MRRRYIIVAGELVEVTDRPVELRADAGALWGDASYAGLRASDGTPIDTRTKHREYMKRTGLTTVDDFTGSFNRAEKAREKFYGGAPDPTRARDIARALERKRG